MIWQAGLPAAVELERMENAENQFWLAASLVI